MIICEYSRLQCDMIIIHYHKKSKYNHTQTAISTQWWRSLLERLTECPQATHRGWGTSIHLCLSLKGIDTVSTHDKGPKNVALTIQDQESGSPFNAWGFGCLIISFCSSNPISTTLPSFNSHSPYEVTTSSMDFISIGYISRSQTYSKVHPTSIETIWHFVLLFPHDHLFWESPIFHFILCRNCMLAVKLGQCHRWNSIQYHGGRRMMTLWFLNDLGESPHSTIKTGASYFICGLCDFSWLYWMHWSIYCGSFNNVPKNLIDVLRVGLGRQCYDTHRLWFPYIFHTHSEKVSFFGGLTPGALVLHRSQIQQTKDNKHSPKNHPWPLTTTIPSPLYSQCLPPRLWVPVTALLLTKLHQSPNLAVCIQKGEQLFHFRFNLCQKISQKFWLAHGAVMACHTHGSSAHLNAKIPI